MDIIKYDIYRGPNIGIYTSVNDEFVFIPSGFTKTKAVDIAKHLNVDYLTTSVGNTRVIGILMVVNNHGLLLPQTSYPNEIEHLEKSTGLNVGILKTKHNALGNMMSVNDKGAIVSPLIEKENLEEIKQVLDVEVIQKRVAGHNQVGAMTCSNSEGGVIHPQTDEKDIEIFSDVMGVNLEPGTINGGVPFISSGMIANNKSMIVGSFTTGPEIMMLTHAFIN